MDSALDEKQCVDKLGELPTGPRRAEEVTLVNSHCPFFSSTTRPTREQLRKCRWATLVSLLLIAVFALLASSCGDDDDDDDGDGEAAAEATEEAGEPRQEETSPADTPPEEGPNEEATGEETVVDQTATEPTAEFDEQAVADFYADQTVRIIVGASAGGGYDLQARLVAEYLGEYIPGNPTVIVENMPGAAQLIAGNHVANVAPADGTVIGLIAGALVVDQLLANPNVEFDFRDLQYLGVVSQDEYIIPATEASGVTNFEQILNGEELTIGALGSTGPSIDVPILLEEVLGANFNIIPGYGGVADVALAMDSGEVESVLAIVAAARTVYREQFETSWNALVTLTEERVDDMPEVPAVLEFTETEEQEQILRLGAIGPGRVSRPYFVAADVPEDRVAALQNAFQQMLQDEEFLAAAEAQGVNPLTGQEVRDIFAGILNMPEETKNRLQELLPSRS
ncbi:MAG: hypothetical protein GEU28_05335 [Dehalococcoidia bacterium]|nr:hypothetical protein [Dehalococcoidia bacterium]